MELKVRNVNVGFEVLVRHFHRPDRHGAPVVSGDSRNGPVLYVPEPVTLTYVHPRERVLFNTARDANPFFHLYEALWMLAGRDEVESVAHYASNMINYSDNGELLHGAYGYRWRTWFGFDQLDWIIGELRATPSSRRCVLQMWDATVEPPHTWTDRNDPWMASHGGKDVPCNTQAYFALRPGPELGRGQDPREWPDHRPCPAVLDMTVCNRSNDLVWGMLGANAVHFSFLQEYLADCLGAEVGYYHQFTNNLHVYQSNFNARQWLGEYMRDMHSPPSTTYGQSVHPYAGRLVQDKAAFDAQVLDLTAAPDACEADVYDEPFLRDVAQPMLLAFRRHKQRRYLGDHGAFAMMQQVQASDWRTAGSGWLHRRYASYIDKASRGPTEAAGEE